VNNDRRDRSPSPDRSSTRTPRVSEAGRAATAYNEIRQRILSSEYEPGVPLSEYQIAALLKLSRTPVREALKQLEQEGLVWSIPQKGVFVTDLTVSDVDEIYEIREQLETFAARVAAVEMSDDEVAQLITDLQRAKEAPDGPSVEDAFEADIRLHAAIIAVTRNRRLAQILATLRDQVHRIRTLSTRVPGRLEAALEEHIEIMESIQRRDPDGAVKAMANHLKNARANAVSLLRPLTRV
jgi:DNA-binding GntR family transcriptional regulator